VRQAPAVPDEVAALCTPGAARSAERSSAEQEVAASQRPVARSDAEQLSEELASRTVQRQQSKAPPVKQAVPRRREARLAVRQDAAVVQRPQVQPERPEPQASR
jgi:hypothetical protein